MSKTPICRNGQADNAKDDRKTEMFHFSPKNRV